MATNHCVTLLPKHKYKCARQLSFGNVPPYGQTLRSILPVRKMCTCVTSTHSQTSRETIPKKNRKDAVQVVIHGVLAARLLLFIKVSPGVQFKPYTTRRSPHQAPSFMKCTSTSCCTATLCNSQSTAALCNHPCSNSVMCNACSPHSSTTHDGSIQTCKVVVPYNERSHHKCAVVPANSPNSHFQ